MGIGDYMAANTYKCLPAPCPMCLRDRSMSDRGKRWTSIHRRNDSSTVLRQPAEVATRSGREWALCCYRRNPRNSYVQVGVRRSRVRTERGEKLTAFFAWWLRVIVMVAISIGTYGLQNILAHRVERFLIHGRVVQYKNVPAVVDVDSKRFVSAIGIVVPAHHVRRLNPCF